MKNFLILDEQETILHSIHKLIMILPSVFFQENLAVTMHKLARI